MKQSGVITTYRKMEVASVGRTFSPPDGSSTMPSRTNALSAALRITMFDWICISSRLTKTLMSLQPKRLFSNSAHGIAMRPVSLRRSRRRSSGAGSRRGGSPGASASR